MKYIVAGITVALMILGSAILGAGILMVADALFGPEAQACFQGSAV